MKELLNNLVISIYKKQNKKPSTLFLNTLASYNKISPAPEINIDYMATKIKNQSYKAYLIFSQLKLTTQIICLIYVLINVKKTKIEIPVKKIALGFVHNILIYKDKIDTHLYNILIEIHSNSLVYLKLKNDRIELYKEYEEIVINGGDDLLEFYINMYKIYVKINSYREEKVIVKHEKNKDVLIEILKHQGIIKTDLNDYKKNYDYYVLNKLFYTEYFKKSNIVKYLEIFKKVFLIGRSDFLENLFYNFKQIKKMSQMSYSFTLQETIKCTFYNSIDNFEIILNEKNPYNFNLIFNVEYPMSLLIDKEYIYKLSKIFKFMFRCKKIEYLIRKNRNPKYETFIKKIYFYICEDVIEKLFVIDDILQAAKNCEDLLGIFKIYLHENINKILSNIYLEDDTFYKFIKEFENIFYNNLVNNTTIDEKFLIENINKMYNRTGNKIFKISK